MVAVDEIALPLLLLLIIIIIALHRSVLSTLLAALTNGLASLRMTSQRLLLPLITITALFHFATQTFVRYERWWMEEAATVCQCSAKKSASTCLWRRLLTASLAPSHLNCLSSTAPLHAPKTRPFLI